MFKRFLFLLVSAIISAAVVTTPTFADGPYTNGNSCRFFLGMVSWDCGTKFSTNEPLSESDLQSSIIIVASNVLTDLGIIAAYLVLGYTIYGGYLYTFSRGDPGKTAAGKNTLARAFIGLAIVMSATTIFSFIRIVLIGQNNNLANCYTYGATEDCVTENVLISNAIEWAIGVAGTVAAVFIIYGGISYITASGDPTKVKKARDMILYAGIGLVIVALAQIITAFVSNAIRSANQPATFLSYTQSIITPKEEHETQIIN